MNELIEKIEKCILLLIKYDTKGFGESAQDIVNGMMMLIPQIISCYNDPKMEDLREDALYWPGQLERIISSLENDDSFAIVDILYNEMRANLMELRDTLAKRGLV